MDIDDTGRDLEGWAEGQGLYDALRAIEVAFGTAAIALSTLVLAVVMYVKHHRRAGTLILAVMVATLLLSQGVKLLDRPGPAAVADLPCRPGQPLVPVRTRLPTPLPSPVCASCSP